MNINYFWTETELEKKHSTGSNINNSKLQKESLQKVQTALIARFSRKNKKSSKVPGGNNDG